MSDLSHGRRSALRLVTERVRRPAHDLLLELESYDVEVFGRYGLRSYDLAVMAEAGAVFVARLGDEIVAGCQLIRELEQPEYLYVVGFYVRPGWQGKGIGRAFLEAIAEEAKRLGAGGFVLTVSPDNVRAIRLYESAGFVNERFIPAFYGEGEDRYILRWDFDRGRARIDPLQGSV
jgi:ribosomal-protein-alanine N-acetyltransferase